jgi:hypothetical protein
LASRRLNECLGSEVGNAPLQLDILRKDWQYALVIIKEPQLVFDLLSSSCVLLAVKLEGPSFSSLLKYIQR